MFTGLIQHVGTVRNVARRGIGAVLSIDIGPLAEGVSLGDSIAVSGTCLTARSLAGTVAEFDAVAETLARTTLGDLRGESKVNLEPALAAQGRFDGHIVQGHVDGQATVASVERGDAWTISFTADADVAQQLVAKGSIAIDGVSLTLARASERGFSVAIIPTTLADTTLGSLSVGQSVNVECDILGKYIRQYLQQIVGGDKPGGLSMDALRNAGFM